MLHGKSARFPPGATVYLLKGALTHLPQDQQDALTDELASVKSFDVESDLWEVAPSRPQLGGGSKSVLVKEQGMRLAFCILAQHALPGGGSDRSPSIVAANRALAPKRKIKRSPTPNGSKACGGGMLALEDITPGEGLLTEHPFLLSSTGVEHRWSDRWRAYLTMMGGAQYGSAPAKAALARFDALAAGDPEDVESFVEPRAKATEIVESALRSAGKVPESEEYEEIKCQQVEKVLTVLMKWQANAHLYRNVTNGDMAGAAGTAVAAVYSLIACVNHSCRPNCDVAGTWSAQKPGSGDANDGAATLTCVSAVAAGEECVYNYGPRELLTWNLEKRRRYLSEKNGFVCRCERCREEESNKDATTCTVSLSLASIEDK
eukprot:CAMPEP_0181366604 /NCGR_PEP_ID=MMETSP1106-20121128/10802_1 /TAXON_ID=81844 /ORGANISM="Mantoniella antarctica, Strain SL-175" /LENGTH=375 /DNA_ID=CAMNT_0023481983 /DNA_START=341 /DNA_END=1468 /DNA_ORIENTATION=-